MEMFTTANGKEIKVVRSEQSGLYTIMFHSGGEVPKEFKGQFTSLDKAKAVIKKYMYKKELEAAKKELKQEAKPKAPVKKGK